MTQPLLRRGFAALVLVGVASTVAAHDFWIEASNWRPVSKELVPFDLRIGHPGESESYGRNPEHIRRFVALRADARDDDAGAEIAIVGRAGRAPAGLARFQQEGLYRVLYESNPNWIELPAEKFKGYLVEEGLEEIVRQRDELDESEQPGLELYRRCAIAVVPVGRAAATDPSYGAPLGLELELVPAVNPTTVRVGEELVLRLLKNGEALEGTLVCLDALQGTSVEPQTARTDAEGRVRFTLRVAGGYLVTAVHMQRAPEEVRTRDEQRADWASLWTSLTFATAAPEK